MKWLQDNTGRFAQRPHYELAELDTECEEIVTAFLSARYGNVTYPITTNDLTVLVEKGVQSLDLYADLTGDGDGIEGVTDFFPGHKPKVRVAAELSEDARRENRLRTTLTHELGHVHFHTALWDMGSSIPLPLFGNDDGPGPTHCHRDGMLGVGRVDWLEWQAGYASGAFLMPYSELCQLARGVRDATGAVGVIALNTAAGRALMDRVRKRFHVSEDAARVRLIQLGQVTADAPTKPLLTSPIKVP